MKIRLIKLKSNHDNLRTDIIDGECRELPRINEDFVMAAESLSGIEGVRVVRTTPVRMISYDKEIDMYMFETQNSTYQIKVLRYEDMEAEIE